MHADTPRPRAWRRLRLPAASQHRLEGPSSTDWQPAGWPGTDGRHLAHSPPRPSAQTPRPMPPMVVGCVAAACHGAPAHSLRFHASVMRLDPRAHRTPRSDASNTDSVLSLHTHIISPSSLYTRKLYPLQSVLCTSQPRRLDPRVRCARCTVYRVPCTTAPRRVASAAHAAAASARQRPLSRSRYDSDVDPREHDRYTIHTHDPTPPNAPATGRCRVCARRASILARTPALVCGNASETRRLHVCSASGATHARGSLS
jgi:hypothetical protein